MSFTMNRLQPNTVNEYTLHTEDKMVYILKLYNEM